MKLGREEFEFYYLFQEAEQILTARMGGSINGVDEDTEIIGAKSPAEHIGLPKQNYGQRKMISGAGMLLGVAGAVVFSSLVFKNFSACALAGILFLVSFITIIVHMRAENAESHMEKWRSYPSTFLMRFFGALGICAGAIGLIYSVVNAGFGEVSFSADSQWVSAIWGLVLLVYSSLLVSYGNVYAPRYSALQQHYGLLSGEENA